MPRGWKNDPVPPAPKTVLRRSTDPIEDEVPEGYEKPIPERKFHTGDQVVVPSVGGDCVATIGDHPIYSNSSGWVYTINYEEKNGNKYTTGIRERMILPVPMRDRVPPRFKSGDLVKTSWGGYGFVSDVMDADKLAMQNHRYQVLLLDPSYVQPVPIADTRPGINWHKAKDEADLEPAHVDDGKSVLPDPNFLPSTCPKCRYSDEPVTFKPVYRRISNTDKFTDHHPLLKDYIVRVAWEYLVWTCQGCGYDGQITRCYDYVLPPDLRAADAAIADAPSDGGEPAPDDDHPDG